MITVIEHGKKCILREPICRSCGCKLSYEKVDVIRDMDGPYIICPDCGNFIDVNE